jgi:hypothetical protein
MPFAGAVSAGGAIVFVVSSAIVVMSLTLPGTPVCDPRHRL